MDAQSNLCQPWAYLEFGLLLLLLCEWFLHFSLLTIHQLVPEFQPHQQGPVGSVVTEQLCVGLGLELLHPELSLLLVFPLLQPYTHDGGRSKPGHLQRGVRPQMMERLTTQTHWPA